MAKRKKSGRFAGEINFYKAMTVLGILIAIGFAYGFLKSAPNLSRKPFHIATDPPGECMACHVKQAQNIPIMPHRPMDFCTFCHTPVKDKA